MLTISDFNELQAWQSAFNKAREFQEQQARQKAQAGGDSPGSSD